MSKNSLYLIVAIALAATAASFFVSGTDSLRVCYANEGSAGTPAVMMPAGENSSAPIKATVRGYPLHYYEEPFPADCASSSAGTGMFDAAHLTYDFLIWLGVAILLFLPSTLYKLWSGPKMLGDNVRRA